MDKTMKEKSLIIKKYKDMFETFRLDYEGTPFSADGNTHWEMEFEIANAEDMSQIKTPYGEHYGGTANEPKPFKGSGYTGGRNGTIIPEWKINNRIEIKDNSILSKYVDGKCVEKYRYYGERWIKIEIR